jgi:DNA-directed RNA polymerase subunit RPC12/RpoP
MTIYTCSKCGRQFNRKSSYDNHLKKKRPCSPKDIPKYVMKNGKRIDELITGGSQLELLIKKMEEMQKENNIKMEQLQNTHNEIMKKSKRDSEMISKLVENNKILTEEVIKLREMNSIAVKGDRNNNTNSNNTNTNANNNNNNTYYVNINQFGKETDEHLTDIEAKKILNKGYNSIPEYITAIHFDEKKPENHNVYMPNWRDNKILVYNGTKWNLEDKDTVLSELKTKGVNYIQKKYDELDVDDENDAKIIKKVDRFLNSYNNEEKDKIKELNTNILLVLYNNKTIAEKTRKVKKQIIKKVSKNKCSNDESEDECKD